MHTAARALAREPLLQFIALGSLIWIGVAYHGSLGGRYTIEIDAGQRQRIAFAYQQQFGRPPTPDAMREFIERYVREEIMQREALALGLDKNDEIVRRRIIQKYEFLQADPQSAVPPGDAVLQEWFQRNQNRYITPALATFSHIYFSADNGDDEVARSRATAMLAALRMTPRRPIAESGDPFPGPREVSAASGDDARRLFGQSELANQLFVSPAGEWSGPFRSGYGWHLVWVVARTQPLLPAFEDIRERLLADYREDRQRQYQARAFEKVHARYTVRYDGE